MITLETVKGWLKLDSDEFDDLAAELLLSAKSVCADILRLDSPDDLEDTPLIKLSVLYAMAYLLEHREDADHNKLKTNLRALLEPERPAAF